MSPGGFDMEFVHSAGFDLWHFFNKYYWFGIIAFVHREDDHLIGDGPGKWLVNAFSTSESSFNFYIHPSFLSEYSSARWFPLVAGLIPLWNGERSGFARENITPTASIFRRLRK